jgi:hypothetical protein
MGFRYRKRVWLGNGLGLNLSKSGVSLSVGGRGLTTNFSRRGVRTTVGLPGTGLSYTTSRRRRGGAGAGLLGIMIILGLLYLLLR